MVNSCPQSSPDPCDRFLECAIALLVAVILAIAITACSPRVIETIHTEYRDTTIIKETVKDTTIYVPIPLESNQVIVALGDTSRLETSVAVSSAYVTHDGLLYHDLANRHDSSLAAIVPIYHYFTHTIQSAETAHIITKTVEVAKPLSWWQTLKIRSFWPFCGALFALLVWTFRKPLWKLIKR